MKLLKTPFLFGFLVPTKTIYTCLVYKVLTIFNYSIFFNLKLQLINNYYYKLYLLNVNFYFLFLDYSYLFNYIRYLNKDTLFLTSMPVKIKSFSVLRSPFVFSKSQEHFEIQTFRAFFKIQLWTLSTLYCAFLDHILLRVTLHSSKFWFKRICSF